MFKRLIVSAAALMTAGGLAAGGAAAATPASSSAHVRVYANCQTPAYRPTRIVIACGDYGYYVYKLHYGKWTVHSARGTGVGALNSCDPNCAKGNFIRRPMHFRLYRPVSTAHGRVFTRLAITYSKAFPHRPRHEIDHLSTKPV